VKSRISSREENRKIGLRVTTIARSNIMQSLARFPNATIYWRFNRSVKAKPVFPFATLFLSFSIADCQLSAPFAISLSRWRPKNVITFVCVGVIGRFE